MVRVITLAAASTAMLASSATAFTITFTNECPVTVNLYTRLARVYTDNTEPMAPGDSIEKTIGKGFEGHYRNGTNDAATLAEFSTVGDLDLTWYDISIVPPHLNPGFEFCKSLEECQQNSRSGIGFNTPLQIKPLSNVNGQNCRPLTCMANGCPDAYNFPQDDTKTHSCPSGTNFRVTFCPKDDSTQQQDQVVQQQVEQKPVQQQDEQNPVQQQGEQKPAQQQDEEKKQEKVPAASPPATTTAQTIGAPVPNPADQKPATSNGGAGTVHVPGDDKKNETAATGNVVTQTQVQSQANQNETPATPASKPKSKHCV